VESKKRHIQSGAEYEHYFSKASGTNELIKRHSTLQDTVVFLPKAIQRIYYQAEEIAPLFRGQTKQETCRNIWNWVYAHIDYEKDDKGKEQIRSFRRSFWDRFRGVDCDDYTVFISCLLCCLGIKHILRVAKYTEDNGFQHIYPVVPLSNNNYITVDCVVDKFNYEVPFIEKIDTAMDLEFLDGINGIEDANTKLYGIDANDLMGEFEEMGDLGKDKFRDSKLGKGLVKAVHVANLVNPAATLLRVGILAALKVNMFKISEKLRFAYLDSETASTRNLDMSKFHRLQSVKEKLEKIFFGSGGKIESFKKAILTGRGNRNKEVPLSGLGEVDYKSYSQDDTLAQILGVDSYASETSGVEGLGVVATSAAIAAATTVLTAIAGLLKSIGSLKKGGKDGDSSPDGTTDSTNPEPISTSSISDDTNASASANSSATSTDSTTANTNGGENKSNSTDTPANSGTPATATDDGTNSSNVAKTVTDAKDAKPVGLIEKVKDWVNKNKLATGIIAVTAVGLGVWGFLAYNKKRDKDEKKEKEKLGMAGVPKNKKKSKRHKKKGHHHISYQKLK
jgi:hypothetical protein